MLATKSSLAADARKLPAGCPLDWCTAEPPRRPDSAAPDPKEGVGKPDRLPSYDERMDLDVGGACSKPNDKLLAQ